MKSKGWTLESLTKYFSSRVNKTDDCWLWTGSIDKCGYGLVWHGNEKFVAHRVSLFLKNKCELRTTGTHDHVDHLCRNTKCVNPKHLEVVSCKTNVLRGNGITAKNLRKTHCKHGHELKESNLKPCKRGWRRCKACANSYYRKNKAKNRP